MRAPVKFAFSFFAVFAAVSLFRHGERAMDPERPRDMPVQSTFVQSSFDISRNVPEGEWIGCGQDAGQGTNYCRVSDEKGVVVFEGDFLPLASDRAVPASELKLAPRSQASLWVEGPAEGGPVPVIPLLGGGMLVPADDREALTTRWAEHPDELARIANGQGTQ